MGSLTDQLGTDNATKAANCAHLLRPLEIIAGSDDSVVQNKAVASLKKIPKVLTDETIHSDYIELVRRLKKGDFFSMRIAACHLYAQIYERLNDEKRAVVRKKFAKLVKDDTPMVRWGSA